jgi:ribosomal protein S18 acetylase RimI-like enzyme
MVLSEKDVDAIALLHIDPSGSTSLDASRRTSSFRFFRDKVRLFQEFDTGSTLLERGSEVAGSVEGVLIYTWDERAFNRFAGPPSARFFSRVLKTLFGYYGFAFSKYAKAGASMIGFSGGGEAAASAVPSGRYGKIWVLIVSEGARGRGIAGKLLERCVSEASSRGTEALMVTVRTDNAPAIRVYERAGFEKVGECSESSGRSFVMLKHLPPPESASRVAVEGVS